MLKKFTKKQLLEERAISYDPQHTERMNSDIENKLSNRTHHLGAHPAFPNTDINQNFEEKIASDRFKDVVGRAKRYGAPTTLDVASIQSVLGILNQIIGIEQQHKDALEKLAVALVKKEFGVGDDVDLLPNLSGEEDINFENMQMDEPETDEFEPEDINDLENANAEIHKRKLINALTQGSAKKGHYMFHLVEDKLNRIDPNLVNLYGKLMSVTDLNYWQIDDETIAELAKMQASRVGEEQVGFEGDENDPRDKDNEDDNQSHKPYVRAAGRIFPVLVHELIKGLMEIMSMHGLPEDEKLRQHVLSKSDFLQGESWDIRLGPGLWEKFLDAIDENDWDIKHHLYTDIVKMPAQEFNNFMKELFAGTRKGKQKLVDLANQIKKEIQEDEYNKHIQPIDSNDNDDSDDDDIDQIDISDLFR